MLKQLSAVAFFAILTSTANAQLTLEPVPPVAPGYSLSATAAVVYSGTAPSSTGSYSAFAAATGSAGYDDYTTTLAPTANSLLLSSLSFVGGVTFTGTVPASARTLRFEFYDFSGTTLLNNFSVSFASSGAFLYTLDTTNVLPADFVVATDGILQITATGTTMGRFFLTSTPPSIGSNDPTFGGAMTSTGTPLYHAFSLSGTAVPEPGSIALFAGLMTGGVSLMARRRRK